MMSFDYVVSLGAWCQTAYQIKAQNLPILANSFDWLVTPWSSLIQILETDGLNFGLSATFDNHSRIAKCDHYGVLYAHEFDAEFRQFTHTNEPVLNPPRISEERLAQCRQKMLYKHRKMVSTLMNGGKVLFIRQGATAEPAMAWPYLADANPRNEEDLNYLIRLLRAKFPDNDAKLLYVWQEPIVHHELNPDLLDQNIFISGLDWPKLSGHWEGDDNVWRKVLDGLRDQTIVSGRVPSYVSL